MVFEEISIEIETRCNARCFYCDTGNKSRGAHRKWMELDQFERVLDHALSIEIVDTNSVINLFDRGEPTLHPRISDIVRALDDRSLRYCLSTNCGLLPRLDDQVSMAGLEKLVISMPGFSQASYDRIHRLPFDKVLGNIRAMLLDFKRRGFSGDPVMSMHVYRFNLAELEPASRFCASEGIVFSPYCAFFNDNVWTMDFLSGRLSDNVMGRAREELFLDRLIEQARNAPSNFRCPQYDRVVINEEGQLVLCAGAPRPNNTYYDGYLLGDFLNMSADEILLRKTTSKACSACLSCGAAYLQHSAIRPDQQFSGYQRPATSVITPLDIEAVLNRESCSWMVVENGTMQSEAQQFRLSESPSYGFHRVLCRIDGCKKGQTARLSLLAKPAERSRLKLEIADNAEGYVTGSFHLKGVQQRAADRRGISEGGFHELEISLPLQIDSSVHFSITMMDRDNGVIYRGRQGASLLLRDVATRMT